ncbi:MAG: polyprenyl synthetase family protein [Armatimonadetes bacterium]|nr:polyprenyl synthetase family protein [Armatimonadota bacterium]
MSATLSQIYAPVQTDLDGLQALFHKELSADDPFLEGLVGSVLETRGKLVRPALTFLSARTSGSPAPETRLVAAAVELIHVASLIHDDVIDESDLRRGHRTANVRWGNHVAVLLGDYLFAKSFHMFSRVAHRAVATQMALATVRMTQAEILQIKHGSRPHDDESVYFRIVEGKTAQLVSSACASGAYVAGASPERATALGSFGLHWGIAFQIIDDTLDFTSDPTVLGKPIGSDVRGGKMTLPLIHAYRTGTEADRARIAGALSHGEASDLLALVSPRGSIEYALDVARSHARSALAIIESLPAGAARDSLAAITEFVLARRN